MKDEHTPQQRVLDLSCDRPFGSSGARGDNTARGATVALRCDMTHIYS